MTYVQPRQLYLGARVFFEIAACATIIASCAGPADDEAARTNAEDDVRQAVNSKLAAYASPDVDKYFSYYADDMSFCCRQGGWRRKEDYYSSWKDRVAKGGAPTKAASADIRLQASPKADAVIASYQMPITLGGDKPEDQFFNMTEVWMKASGRWQVEALTFSPGKAEAPGPATMAAKKP